MNVIIMAGGEGSRLRPLTSNLPKPMARLCGRPIIEYIMELLIKHKFGSAFITLRYMPDEIINHFPENCYKGLELSFFEEDKPLGTAGSVKNAWDKTDPEVLVISGDAMCDFDLSSAVEFHRRNRADVTIISKKVDDPREYGLIDVNPDNTVNAFIEKPAYSQAVSDLANTGIYILSASAMNLIPDGKFYDFAKDLFPLMLRESMKIMAYEDPGYWCDIGDLKSYVSCQTDMLEGKIECNLPAKRDKNGSVILSKNIDMSININHPVFIGSNVTVENGCEISGSVIDNGCYIGCGSRITGSIVLQNSYIGDKVKLTGSVLCSGANVKSSVMMFEGSTVGSKAIVGEKSIIAPGVKIWNGKTVAPEMRVSEHIKFSTVNSGFFSDEGLAGQIGIEFTPEYVAKIGAAVGSLDPNVKYAVGCSNQQGTKILKDALSAGILSTGAEVVDFGENFKAQFEFAMNLSSIEVGVYIRGGVNASISVMTDGGLPANRETERNIEIIISRGEFIRAPYNKMGIKTVMNNVGSLYNSQLLKFAIAGLDGVKCMIKSQNNIIQKTLREILFKLGCDISQGDIFEISPEGDKLSIMTQEHGIIPYSKVLVWCAVSLIKKGRDISVPFDAPQILNELAREHKVKIYRYFDTPADKSDMHARELAQYQIWSRDALMQTVMILSLIKKENGIGNLISKYPDFSVKTKTVNTRVNPARILRELNTEKSDIITEGVIINKDNGIVLLKPLKRGMGLKIMAEAVNAEIANEICDDIEKLLNEKLLQ